jgi:hypothetical protein
MSAINGRPVEGFSDSTGVEAAILTFGYKEVV